MSRFRISLSGPHPIITEEPTSCAEPAASQRIPLAAVACSLAGCFLSTSTDLRMPPRVCASSSTSTPRLPATDSQSGPARRPVCEAQPRKADPGRRPSRRLRSSRIQLSHGRYRGSMRERQGDARVGSSVQPSGPLQGQGCGCSHGWRCRPSTCSLCCVSMSPTVQNKHTYRRRKRGASRACQLRLALAGEAGCMGHPVGPRP